jgi:ribonuclease D
VIKTIEKEKIKELPSLKFEGDIVVCRSFECAKKAFKKVSRESAIGFDTESRPSFKKGVKYPLALLQLATKNEVFIIQLLQCEIGKLIGRLFTDKKVLKIGIGIRDDLRELNSIEPFQARHTLDLNEWAPQLGFEKIGAKNLSAMVLGGRISKQQQTSNWAVKELSQAQIEYAATDAWICIMIYQKLLEAGFEYQG